MKVYLQIDEVQDAKYEIAKHINKITTKYTQIPTKEEHQNLLLDGRTVHNKGKLILTEIFPSVQEHDI